MVNGSEGSRIPPKWAPFPWGYWGVVRWVRPDAVAGRGIGNMDLWAQTAGMGQAENPRRGELGRGEGGRGEGEVAFVEEGELSQSSRGQGGEGENPRRGESRGGGGYPWK